MSDGPTNEQYLNKSLDKALSILDLFDHEQEELTVTEVADKMDKRPGTIYPTLFTLVQHGYLKKEDNKKYKLGLRFLEKSNYLLTRMDLLDAAKPLLKDLASDLRCNSHLAVLYDFEVMYIHREEGYPSVTINGIIGRRAPAYCTALGKALLSGFDDEEMDTYLKKTDLVTHTPNTITDPLELEDEIAKVRERGYAIDDEEFHEGNFCVAGPVQDFEEKIIAAESVSTHKNSSLQDNLTELVERVTGACKETSRKIGYFDNGDGRR